MENAFQVAHHEGWTVVDTFEDDMNNAAESVWDRPGGAAMRARLGEADAVLVPNRDSVSRLESDFQVFDDHGVRV